MRIVENSLGYFKYNILYHIKFEHTIFNLMKVESNEIFFLDKND